MILVPRPFSILQVQRICIVFQVFTRHPLRRFFFNGSDVISPSGGIISPPGPNIAAISGSPLLPTVPRCQLRPFRNCLFHSTCIWRTAWNTACSIKTRWGNISWGDHFRRGTVHGVTVVLNADFLCPYTYQKKTLGPPTELHWLLQVQYKVMYIPSPLLPKKKCTTRMNCYINLSLPQTLERKGLCKWPTFQCSQGLHFAVSVDERNCMLTCMQDLDSHLLPWINSQFLGYAEMSYLLDSSTHVGRVWWPDNKNLYIEISQVSSESC